MIIDDYLALMRTGNEFPLVRYDGNMYEDFETEEPAPAGAVAHFTFARPLPSHPRLADLHSASGYFLISHRLRDALAQFDAEGFDLVPATLQTSDQVHPYTYLHVWREFEGIDRAHTVGRWDDMDGIMLETAERLAFDDAAFAKIPLKKRLIFRLFELPSEVWVHRTVADALRKVPDTKGFALKPAREWGSNSKVKKAK